MAMSWGSHIAPWEDSSDVHPVRQMASDEVYNDFQHIVVPGGVVSQVEYLCSRHGSMTGTLRRAGTGVSTASSTSSGLHIPPTLAQ